LFQLFSTEADGAIIREAYFGNDVTINLMHHILHGLQRGVLNTLG
jgi:hypothetical protein